MPGGFDDGPIKSIHMVVTDEKVNAYFVLQSFATHTLLMQVVIVVSLHWCLCRTFKGFP